MIRRRIGITLGDVTGIGPEIVNKALESGQLDGRFDYEIIGDPHTKCRAEAHTWLLTGARRCLTGELSALVTAPVTKDLVAPWPGQTELLANVAQTKKFAMMLVGGPLRVALVTIHEPISRVPSLITGKRILDVASLTHDFCRRLGIRKPRIGVCGLNPHAGENGLIGSEEKKIIAPAVKRAARLHPGITGPWPADTLFHKAYHGQFDAVIAMYHDQGLAPLKMIALDSGVNLTLGLPFIRTSPDHGTAHDIAGKGIARPDSMIAAINMAAKLAAKKK